MGNETKTNAEDKYAVGNNTMSRIPSLPRGKKVVNDNECDQQGDYTKVYVHTFLSWEKEKTTSKGSW